jgi:hypothetical protein
VRNKAISIGGTKWIDDLAGLVSHLEVLWSITVGRTYEDSTEPLVAEAKLEGGTEAVLKLLIPVRTQNKSRNVASQRSECP